MLFLEATNTWRKFHTKLEQSIHKKWKWSWYFVTLGINTYVDLNNIALVMQAYEYIDWCIIMKPPGIDLVVFAIKTATH